MNEEGSSIAVMAGGSPTSSVSKAGLTALTRLLAGELARDGILVNAACPGRPASEGLSPGPDHRSDRRQRHLGVTIPNGGPTGTFTRDGQPFPW